MAAQDQVDQVTLPLVQQDQDTVHFSQESEISGRKHRIRPVRSEFVVLARFSRFEFSNNLFKVWLCPFRNLTSKEQIRAALKTLVAIRDGIYRQATPIAAL